MERLQNLAPINKFALVVNRLNHLARSYLVLGREFKFLFGSAFNSVWLRSQGG